MRKLIKQFEAKKQSFSSTSQPQDIKLDLPEPLRGLTIEDRVNSGELIIYRSESLWCFLDKLLIIFSEEMKKLINSCVNGVINLIKDQINKVSNDKQRRTKVKYGNITYVCCHC